MPNADGWRFHFWTMWLDRKRRTWAQRHEFHDAQTARAAHAHAAAFVWRTEQMVEPMVGDLYAVAAGTERSIEPAVRFGEPTRGPRTGPPQTGP